VTFLIDGYNLLHAIGLANRSLPAKQFERARIRLLDWLADRKNDHDSLRVIFDAQKSSAPSPESNHRGITVQFSFGQTADEHIEDMLLKHADPARLAVVSNDGQVQEAARRRGSAVFTCPEFVDRLISAPPAAAPSTDISDEKSSTATAAERAEWLEVFSQPRKRKKP
jgi:predicted RNA-binding protein with PIN domain